MNSVVPTLTSPAGKVARPEIRGLTGARFFAAFAVICFHFYKAPGTPRWIERILSGGDLGVRFFFVLSGFILAYNYVHAEPIPVKWKDCRAFWFARFARIYPAYLLALVLQVPMLLRTLRQDIPTIGGSPAGDFLIIAFFSAALIQNFALVEPIVSSFNPVGWTLSVEAFFYAIFPWLGQSFANVGVRASIVIIAGSLAWLAFVPAWLIPHLPAAGSFLGMHGQLIWASHPVFLLPMFLVGMAVCRLFLTSRESLMMSRYAWVNCAVLPLVLAAGLACGAHSGLGWALDAVATAYFGLLIFFLAFNVGPISAALSHRSIKLLGEASYALYILQIPIFLCLEPVCASVARQSDGLIYSCLLICSIVAISVIVHLGFEGPVRRFLRARFGQPSSCSPAAIAG